MTTATASPSVEMARELLSTTDGLSEITHPFKGGSHEFIYDEEDGLPVLRIDLGGETYNVDGPAFQSALKMIPGGTETLAERWPMRFLTEPLNWWYDNKEGDFKLFAIGENVVSFAKPKALVFDPKRILDDMVEAVAQYGGKEEVLVSDFVHSIDETRFNVHVPEGMSQRFVEAREGDRTLGGLSFSGSLLGRSKLELAVYTNRVVCSNGLISPDGVSRFSLGHGEEDADGSLERLYDWVSTTTNELFSGQALDTEFGRLVELTQHDVSNHSAEVLADLFHRLRVPVNARSEILEALAEEADGTAYGIVQAFTRASQHSTSLDEAQRYSLMRHAGHASMHLQATCPECRRAVH